MVEVRCKEVWGPFGYCYPVFDEDDAQPIDPDDVAPLAEDVMWAAWTGVLTVPSAYFLDIALQWRRFTVPIPADWGKLLADLVAALAKDGRDRRKFPSRKHIENLRIGRIANIELIGESLQEGNVYDDGVRKGLTVGDFVLLKNEIWDFITKNPAPRNVERIACLSRLGRFSTQIMIHEFVHLVQFTQMGGVTYVDKYLVDYIKASHKSGAEATDLPMEAPCYEEEAAARDFILTARAKAGLGPCSVGYDEDHDGRFGLGSTDLPDISHTPTPKPPETEHELPGLIPGLHRKEDPPRIPSPSDSGGFGQPVATPYQCPVGTYFDAATGKCLPIRFERPAAGGGPGPFARQIARPDPAYLSGLKVWNQRTADAIEAAVTSTRAQSQAGWHPASWQDRLAQAQLGGGRHIHLSPAWPTLTGTPRTQPLTSSLPGAFSRYRR